ncbi:WD40 repeat-like protein, partial [Thelephora ganbajun]
PPPSPPLATLRGSPRYELAHTMPGHTQSISAGKFSPDGTLLASPGGELMKFWSPHTGQLVRNSTRHLKGLSDIAWSSNSVFLASAPDDTTIRIWTVDTAHPISSPRSNTKISYAFCVNYNSTPHKLLSSCCDGDTKIWDITKRKCPKTLHAHLYYVTTVRSNRDTGPIISSGGKCTFDSRIRNSATEQYPKTLAESHNAICQYVQFSPNSKYILSTAHDHAARLWDYQTSRCLKTYTGRQNSESCAAPCFGVTGG